MKIILSKSQWENIGKKTGWIKTALDQVKLQIDDPSIPLKIKQSIEIIKTFAAIDEIRATNNYNKFDITVIIKGTMLHQEELQKITIIPKELNCSIGPVFSGEAHKWLICLWNH